MTFQAILELNFIYQHLVVLQFLDFVYDVGELVELFDLCATRSILYDDARYSRQSTRPFRTQEGLRCRDKAWE